jgi:hypothetical protein
MRKSVVLMILALFSFASLSFSQSNERRTYSHSINDNFNDGSDHRPHRKVKSCKRYHKNQMRRMANADGKVTKRERRMLRMDRRSTY